MLADYHVHCEYSDDSRYPMADVCRDAADMGLDEICFTEHVDYGVKNDVGEPVTRYEDGDAVTNPPYEELFARYAEMREEWNGRLAIRRGLELGVQVVTLEKVEELLARWRSQMDFAILSIHQVDNLEFWNGDYQEGRTQDQINQRYWEEMLAVVNSFDDYGVMGHLDLIRRYDPFGAYPFEKVRDICAEVLRRVIDTGHGIEINTSGIRYGLGEFHPTPAILDLYRDLGGTIVTVGSDSHKPEHLGKYINEAYDLLRAHGFENVYTYDAWKPIAHKL